MISNKINYQKIFSKLTELEARKWIEKNYDHNAISRLKQLKESTERIAEVEAITEAYFEYYEKLPLPRLLDMLANYLLADFIKETASNKSKEKNSFKTDRQIRTIRGKEVLLESDKVDYFNAKRQFNFAQTRTTKERESEKY